VLHPVVHELPAAGGHQVKRRHGVDRLPCACVVERVELHQALVRETAVFGVDLDVGVEVAHAVVHHHRAAGGTHDVQRVFAIVVTRAAALPVEVFDDPVGVTDDHGFHGHHLQHHAAGLRGAQRDGAAGFTGLPGLDLGGDAVAAGCDFQHLASLGARHRRHDLFTATQHPRGQHRVPSLQRLRRRHRPSIAVVAHGHLGAQALALAEIGQLCRHFSFVLVAQQPQQREGHNLQFRVALQAALCVAYGVHQAAFLR
jgi:hypothetical protein